MAYIVNDWIHRVNATNKKYKELLSIDPDMTVKQFAIRLHRSTGSVQNDLMAASWLKTYPKLEDCKSLKEVLIFIKAKKREMKFK